MRLRAATLILAGMNLFGCRDEISIEQQMNPKTTACYIAVAGKDTAWLRIDTAQTIGLFEMNYPEKKQRYLGQFKGVNRGDTIKGHWDFKINNTDKWYRNPVSFLKTKEKLVMGVGKIIMVWGTSHFDGKVPIDYKKSRFLFEEADCSR